MNILIVQPDDFKNWTAIPNMLILDELLKSDEVRLYCYLKSRPSNWQYSAKHIQNLFGWSKNKASKVMSSLRKSGWIELSQAKFNGKFASSVNCCVMTYPVRITPYPTNSVNDENRDTQISNHENSVLRKNSEHNKTNHHSKNESLNKNLSLKDFRNVCAVNNLHFTLESGIAGFLPTTRFRVTATGYIHNITAGVDISKEDAHKIWEYLYTKQDAIIATFTKSNKDVA